MVAGVLVAVYIAVVVCIAAAAEPVHIAVAVCNAPVVVPVHIAAAACTPVGAACIAALIGNADDVRIERVGRNVAVSPQIQTDGSYRLQ